MTSLTGAAGLLVFSQRLSAVFLPHPHGIVYEWRAGAIFFVFLHSYPTPNILRLCDLVLFLIRSKCKLGSNTGTQQCRQLPDQREAGTCLLGGCRYCKQNQGGNGTKGENRYKQQVDESQGEIVGAGLFFFCSLSCARASATLFHLLQRIRH
jgi:hypothetical protein